MTPATPQTSFLATRRGKLVLALLASVAFLDFVDASIVNIALPSIRRDLGFSEQALQWVPSAYLLTYGGFMLLGGRAADLLGRRRILVAGTVLIGVSSLIGGFAGSSEVLVGARLAQGVGAAMMLPAALSILTTTFKEGKERNAALGVWGGMGGLASATGVLLGGLLTEGPGWRWVMFVNPIAALLVLGGIFLLISDDRRRAQLANFDFRGALLGTARDVAVGLHPGEGARSGLELGTHDRRARRGVRAAGRVPDQRAARQEPPAAPLDLPHQGTRRRRCHPARRLRRVPGGVLLPHPVHAERARLLADPDRRRVPAGDRWRRHCRGHLPRSCCPASERDR